MAYTARLSAGTHQKLRGLCLYETRLQVPVPCSKEPLRDVCIVGYFQKRFSWHMNTTIDGTDTAISDCSKMKYVGTVVQQRIDRGFDDFS